jgi:hypothetical protein
MFLKPTKELLQQIKDSGKPIIQMSMEEFLKVSKETGKILSKEEGLKKLKNK